MYFPKINGSKHYLFVTIDRPKPYIIKYTMLMCRGIYARMYRFLPFGITHVLIDNELEFTNKITKK